MNRRLDRMGILTIKNQNLTPDKEAVQAQKQWEQDGTVNEKYLTHTLGDISKGISAFVPESKQDKSSRNKNCRPS